VARLWISSYGLPAQAAAAAPAPAPVLVAAPATKSAVFMNRYSTSQQTANKDLALPRRKCYNDLHSMCCWRMSYRQMAYTWSFQQHSIANCAYGSAGFSRQFADDPSTCLGAEIVVPAVSSLHAAHKTIAARTTVYSLYSLCACCMGLDAFSSIARRIPACFPASSPQAAQPVTHAVPTLMQKQKQKVLVVPKSPPPSAKFILISALAPPPPPPANVILITPAAAQSAAVSAATAAGFSSVAVSAAGTGVYGSRGLVS